LRQTSPPLNRMDHVAGGVAREIKALGVLRSGDPDRCVFANAFFPFRRLRAVLVPMWSGQVQHPDSSRYMGHQGEGGQPELASPRQPLDGPERSVGELWDPRHQRALVHRQVHFQRVHPASEPECRTHLPPCVSGNASVHRRQVSRNSRGRRSRLPAKRTPGGTIAPPEQASIAWHGRLWAETRFGGRGRDAPATAPGATGVRRGPAGWVIRLANGAGSNGLSGVTQLAARRHRGPRNPRAPRDVIRPGY